LTYNMAEKQLAYMIWRNYVTVTLYIQHLAARSARFFKLNDLHSSTFLHVSSVMTDMSRDSIVDRSSLLALALCAVCRQLAFDVAENLWLWKVSCTGCRPIGQWNDFELIPTAKIESRHPVEFPSIYNHCGVMTAWSCKTLKKAFFLRFLEKKQSFTGKFSKSVPKGYIATPIGVLYWNFVKFGRRKWVKSCVRWALESEYVVVLIPITCTVYGLSTFSNTCRKRDHLHCQ